MNPQRGPSNSKRVIRPILTACAVMTALTSCITGPRPTLGPTTSLAPITDPAISEVLDSLSASATTPFTVVYDITTKYGGLTSTAEVTFDPATGFAVLIDDVLYVSPIQRSEVTCTWSEETLTASACTSGIDETRVSYLQLNSRVFKEAVIDRLRRDAQIAAGTSTSRQIDIAERVASCVDVPVIDGSGSRQTKSYCVFSDIGVIASMDTADLSITAVFVDDVATKSLLEVTSE